VSGSNRLVWLQTWKKAMGWCTTHWKLLLFCAKTIVKESCKFELARLKKKKKKEKHFGRLATFWFSAFMMLFSTTGCVFRHENIWKWMIGVITAYMLAVLEILRNLHILRVHAIPTYRVYLPYDVVLHAGLVLYKGMSLLVCQKYCHLDNGWQLV